MTLAQLLALDPAAMWDALPRERQMAIVVPLLLSECANVTAEDDGTDASDADQETAAGIEQANFSEAMEAIEAAFPEILGDDFSALSDVCASMFRDSHKMRVKGFRGRRVIYGGRNCCWIRHRGREVYLGGFKNLGTIEAPIWQAWTRSQVDDERVRRHPDQAYGPFLPPTLNFTSVLSPDVQITEPQRTRHADRHADAA